MLFSSFFFYIIILANLAGMWKPHHTYWAGYPIRVRAKYAYGTEQLDTVSFNHLITIPADDIFILGWVMTAQKSLSNGHPYGTPLVTKIFLAHRSGSLLYCTDSMLYWTESMLYWTEFLWAHRSGSLLYCTDSMLYCTDSMLYWAESMLYWTEPMLEFRCNIAPSAWSQRCIASN